MPSIRLALSGLPDCITIVQPLLGRIVEAFAPYGIQFLPERGVELSADPEDQLDGWSQLAHNLDSRSNFAAPVNLVVTHIPPNHDGSIDGSLIDPAVRGIAAVFLDAFVFGVVGSAQRADLLTQICIHELGHLLNLTHEDGFSIPPGGTLYANAILQSASRLQQPLRNAWQDALGEAQAAGEVLALPLPPILYYPFNQVCRSRLRSLDRSSLPFQGPFRGDPSQAGAAQDNSLELTVKPHRNRRSLDADALYLTVEIRNRGTFALDLPEHLSPEHGTIRVRTGTEGEAARTHQPKRLYCSNARTTLVPNARLVRSLALIGDPEQPLFAEMGAQRCYIDLVDHAAAPNPIRASTTLDVKVRGDAARDLQSKHGSASLRATSPARFHVALLRAQRIRSARERLAALEHCLDPQAPTAIRHRAARDIALQQLRMGRSWPAIRKRFAKLFSAPVHEELHNALKQTRKGWIAHHEHRATGRSPARL